jgi:phospholipid/cholesterol/gamma-HCH transport system substrate-binding protein
MEPEARYTAIGVAILALVVALAAAAVWLSRTGTRAEIRRYTVYFERESLEGLQIGSAVDMRGIQIGRVERLAIQRDNINRVQVTIRIYGNAPVSDNTVAVVERKLVSGVARVALETARPPGPELTRVPPGERYPVIAEGQSDLEQFGDALNRLAITGTGALEGVNELLSERNRKEIMATIADLRAMSARVSAAADHLASSGRLVADAAQKVGDTAQKVGDTADAVGAQAKDTLRDLSRTASALQGTAGIGANELSATLQELRSSAAAVARAAERFDDPRTIVFGPNPQQLGPGEASR